MDCSTLGFSVYHQLPQLTQTHVHWVGDAIQPSHPLSSPSPPTFNLSQHQGLFQLISSLHQVAKLLALQLQHQSFQWIFKMDFLYDWLAWSPCSLRDSRGSSPTPQFKSINSSASIDFINSFFSEKAMAPHSSTLAWKIPWMEEPGRLQSMGLLRVRHNWVTSLSLFTVLHWRRKWQPTPVFLPGESQGWGSLVDSRLWGRTESDTTEVT